MAANYGRPRPVDPLWYRRRHSIRAVCGGGRAVLIPIEELIRQGVPASTYLYQVISRLRCTECGARPSASVS